MSRLSLVLVGILWFVPAHAGIPNTVGWTNTGLNLNSVCQLGANWPSGCAIAEAWGSAGYDSRRGRLMFTGGGHSDGRGNELISFDLGTGSAITDTQTVSRLKDSTSFTSLTTCGQNGSWRSFHPWSSMEYFRGVNANGDDTASEDRFIFSVAGTADAGDIGGNCLISYNIAAGTFISSTLHPELAANRLSGYYGGAFTHDARQHVIIALGQQAIYYYTPRTNTWTKPTQTDYNDDFSDAAVMTATIDPVLKRYYVLGRGKIWYWNISGTGAITRVQPSIPGSCATFLSSMDDGPASYEYYPYQNTIVSWRGGNNLHMYDTVNNICTVTTISGGPTLPGNIHQVAGRFRFVAKDNLFVTCNNTKNSGTAANDQCYALRIDTQNVNTDWLTRKRAPGVVSSQDFDNVADLTNGLHYFVGSAGTAGRAIDTTIVSSGVGSLALIIPAGNASDTPSGEWRDCIIAGCNINTGGPGFGAGQTFYYSYRIRITQSMRTNIINFWRAGTNPTGWKHANIHNLPQGSCGALEFTGTISLDTTVATQIWYTECGGRGLYTAANGTQGLPYIQQGTPFPLTSATNGFSCDFNNPTTGTGNGVGCFNWQWFDEWLTVKGRVQIGTFGSANSSIQVWIARDGGTTLYQVVNSPTYTLTADAPAANRVFNTISFTNFMTGNNQSAPTSATMWYDEFVVSTNDIDLPGVIASGGADTTPPSAPTGVTIQ